MGEEIFWMNNTVWLAWRYFLEGETRRKWGPKVYDIFQYVGRDALLSLETKAQRTSWLVEISIESLIWVICPNFSTKQDLETCWKYTSLTHNWLSSRRWAGRLGWVTARLGWQPPGSHLTVHGKEWLRLMKRLKLSQRHLGYRLGSGWSTLATENVQRSL